MTDGLCLAGQCRLLLEVRQEVVRGDPVSAAIVQAAPWLIRCRREDEIVGTSGGGIGVAGREAVA